jgi:hypothetical protein
MHKHKRPTRDSVLGYISIEIKHKGLDDVTVILEGSCGYNFASQHSFYSANSVEDNEVLVGKRPTGYLSYWVVREHRYSCLKTSI